jgi:GH15 family glucan-1,4-alpha-glucosidase
MNGKVSIGDARIFSLGKVMETEKFPMFKPFLVRALRSLKERIVFNVVPEDDPDQYYQWGTGTWPRCFSILSLDDFGFHEEAYGYLEFMLDLSHQFENFDGIPHLWDSFFINGTYRGDTLYDLNGHSIKLYEAGKFYLKHKHDAYGQKLRDEHYETLKGWCTWIERHMSEEGLVLDVTESNVWNRGYGTFTQAPAAAGIKLFVNIASDMGNGEDVTHFSDVVAKLISGLENHLYGNGGNPYINIPDDIGNCFITYIPHMEIPDAKGNRPKRIGLSCYSLAANYFLQDPDVRLLPADDPKASETLRLALEHLGDPFDPRIIRWHLPKPHPSHLGYGQGQLLMALIYAGKCEEFQKRLEALFDVSLRETGDIYLMQEVLVRS